MKIRHLVIALFGLFVLAAPALAKPGAGSVTPTVSDDHGNKFRVVAVPFSATPIIVSSTSNNAGLGLAKGDWRFRQIRNCSDGNMQLQPAQNTYDVYCASCAIQLSSGTALSNGDFWNTYNQAAIYAVWGPGTSAGGACVEENYNKPE